FEAFDVSAFHYLLKPVEEEKFSRVFARALAGVQQKKKRAKEVLVVRAGGRSFALRRDAIRYVENCAKRVEIHADGKIYEIYAAMSRLEKELGESFYRCHRGYLVNLEHVAEYTNDSITLDSGERVFLAKERYGAFVKAYLRYLRGEGCGDV
ncbi:MAG: LytTR family DNA-binding domain-containing protein, partial [Lachnospiraceae bacterium]|nr:LytTR family DNA-binding domain-containing protein [Lachnospiraceae bacterium]